MQKSFTARFELVVFDWDGTLMDSEAHIVASMRRAIDDLKLPLMDDNNIRNIIGLGLREAIMDLYPQQNDDTVQSIADRYRYHFLADDPCEPFEGAEAVLKQLQQQGYLLAVATGKGRRGLDRVLEATGFGAYFLETRCADETISKPHPQMLLEIMETLDVAPERTLMVGDTEYDLNMAHAAGATALAVDYGVHERERLLACKPAGCLNSIQTLPTWLSNNK
ncbi:MAG: HAD-IA family hydrolase [Gammaproteobacteria bacterium]|nr:HAD-IA family hydrolase [Gammaproteobacteria bacterium]